ncbi:hypothetical protein [Symmachiella macrocystis]|nr:hypothetical protein [Symmachiella macrocystis]
MDGLRIEGLRGGRNGSATVTVSLGREVIECRTLNLTKPKDRDAFVDAICDGREGIDRDEVTKKLICLAADLAKPATKKSADNGRGDPEQLLAGMSKFSRAEARAMLEDRNLLKRSVDDVAALGVAGERQLTATIYLVGTSRLLDSPLAAIVKGPTASGKSYLIRKTTSLFPAEAVLMATQQTPQSLFYMPPDSLSHRFIVAGERSRVENDDTAEATRALREILSEGRLSQLIPLKEGNRMETKLIQQDGPIAFIESTTLTNIFEEDANRCVLLHTDEQPKQTQRIVQRLAAGYGGGAATGDEQRIVERHHAAQRMLKQWPIVIPYAPRLGELFGFDRVEVRRAFPQLISMVRASTLLHQYQRQFDSEARLIASADDYQLARYLLAGPMSRLLGGRISEPARRFADRLADRFAVDEKFTSREAAKGESATRRAVTGWLAELCEAGTVEQLEPHKGSRPATWKRTAAELDIADDCPELPALDDVFPDGHFRHSDKGEAHVA